MSISSELRIMLNKWNIIVIIIMTINYIFSDSMIYNYLFTRVKYII